MFSVTIHMHYGIDRRSTCASAGTALILMRDWYDETGEYVEVEDMERGIVIASLGKVLANE